MNNINYINKRLFWLGPLSLVAMIILIFSKNYNINMTMIFIIFIIFVFLVATTIYSLATGKQIYSFLLQFIEYSDDNLNNELTQTYNTLVQDNDIEDFSFYHIDEGRINIEIKNGKIFYTRKDFYYTSSVQIDQQSLIDDNLKMAKKIIDNKLASV